MADNDFDHVMEMVGEFIETFDCPRDPMFWISMVEEETRELWDAIREEPRASMLKEAADLIWVLGGFAYTDPDNKLFTDAEHATMDAVLNDAHEVSVAWQNLTWVTDEMVMEAMERLRTSNMSKLGADGKPIRRDTDGKIMKGPNYQPPYLADLVGTVH